MFFIQLLLARNEVEKHTTSKKVLKITERETVKVQFSNRVRLSIMCGRRFWLTIMSGELAGERYKAKRNVVLTSSQYSYSSPHHKLSLSIICGHSQIRFQQFLYTPQVHNNRPSIYVTSKTDSD